VLDWLGSDFFTPGEHGAFFARARQPAAGGDPYLVLADFRRYCDCQARVDAAYRDQRQWANMAILKAAAWAKVSSSDAHVANTRRKSGA